MPKILVIDDDASLREVIQLSLEHAGFEVAQADSGVSGVQLACAQLPDLILCDVRMEKMDGYRTLAALRQDTVTAPVPVILMTGQADTAGMRQGMELGADDYLSKPFTVPQLLAAVNARLKKHQTVRELAERKLADLRANICLALPHELLTPLNGILGFTDILITDHRHLQPDEIVSMSEAIRDSAKRLHRLIENFLIFAQIELLPAEQLHALREGQTLDLRKPIERVAQVRAGRVGRVADLLLELGDASAAITEDYFSKIVDELLENAFKFSTPGSPVQVQSVSDKEFFVLRITDHGRGMKAEHIAEVGAYMQFERKIYEQQGSGLGLTIAKRLTELHGGELNIQSELGVGTTVEVRLPCLTAKR
ncbi:MAG: hybrid sensor histidine kinase/response regulator [Verrucomicrobia bacterium]|nr:MAG: hybrid sensor histidine kinase/response regulator [Verrucomicrobiota bacterium]PYM11734.1 MAG: hybrid sensor histidine kinase/response regulator [Verrucomicrobiota bacterium]